MTDATSDDPEGPIRGALDLAPQERVVFGRPAAEALDEEMSRAGLKRAFVTSTRSLGRAECGPLARVLSGGHTPVAPDGWYEDQLAALSAWSTATKTPVVALALPDHTQANPTQCTQYISEKDCTDQANAYRRIVDALGRSGLQWVDGQRIYQASGRPHFMGADRDTGHPTAEGHRVLASGLAPLVRAKLKGAAQK